MRFFVSLQEIRECEWEILHHEVEHHGDFPAIRVHLRRQTGDEITAYLSVL